MSRISSIFKSGRKALIGYLPVGYPDVKATLEAAETLAAGGCDLIELGIPFSDPLADGVTIQRATHQALLNGITVKRCLETASQLRSKVSIPLVFMGYLNPVIRYGIEKFCVDCSSVGIDGLIIPDLPQGELPELDKSALLHGLDNIQFLAPNSSPERIRQVSQNAHGFIYVVSVTGVTGVRNSFSSNLGDLISRVRASTDLPLCIGFGISNCDQAKAAAKIADGIIIGSKIIQLMENNNGWRPQLAGFIGEIRQAIDTI